MKPILCRNRAFNPPSFFLLLVLLLGSLFSACQKNTNPTPTPLPPTPTITPTIQPTATATPSPLGSQTNPLVFGIIARPGDTKFTSNLDALVKQLSSRSKYAITAKTFISYNLLVAAMENGTVQMAWLPPLTYIYTQLNGSADVILLANHFGVYQYGTQFLANITSGFSGFFNPLTNQVTTDAATALKQFKDKRPCWVEPQSVSGYILPLFLLKENKVNILDGVFTQTNPAVIRALYVKGICDFGVTFAISGDPRTSSTVQQDLPDVLDRIMVIWRSEAFIPNLSLSLLPETPRDIREKMIDAHLELIKTDEGKALLSAVHDYDIQDLKIVEDNLFDPLRAAVESTDMNLQPMIGK